VHLANFALPGGRADFGGGAVEIMGSGGVFIAVCEMEPEAVGRPLFAEGVPWPLRPEDFSPENMQRSISGQAGCQRFFSVGDRSFCLYAVIGSHRQRAILVKVVNDALAGLTIG
jgi:hypothetical protein